MWVIVPIVVYEVIFAESVAIYVELARMWQVTYIKL